MVSNGGFGKNNSELQKAIVAVHNLRARSVLSASEREGDVDTMDWVEEGLMPLAEERELGSAGAGMVPPIA
jgi:hypothetical protein